MSDINTIISNYKNKLNKQMADSHQALLDEIASAGGSEWKLISSVSKSTRFNYSEIPNTAKEVMFVIYDAPNYNIVNNIVIDKATLNKLSTLSSSNSYFYFVSNSGGATKYLQYFQSDKNFLCDYYPMNVYYR